MVAKKSKTLLAKDMSMLDIIKDKKKKSEVLKPKKTVKEPAAKVKKDKKVSKLSNTVQTISFEEFMKAIMESGKKITIE